MTTIPETQYAVQITGIDEFRIVTDKPVHRPGPHQILLEVEASGICFSDTKLLHAFHTHPRKAPVAGGVSEAVLAEIPSYVPGDTPTTPGHEPVCRVAEVGEKVTHYKVGDRVLVQADWKHLPTARSNAAFGYNFEGALQEYVLVDERLAVTEDDQFLLPVAEDASAAAIGLVEPWATVEASYASAERTAPLAGGRFLVVADAGRDVAAARPLTAEAASVTVVGADWEGAEQVAGLADLAGRDFHDIVYFGSDADTLDTLGALLAVQGICNVVLDGQAIERAVGVDIGRIHYDRIRYIGTTGDDPAASYDWIPADGAIRENSRVLIIGAAGPMGVMHTIRATVLGLGGMSVVASDVNDDRLATLAKLVDPKAAAQGVEVTYFNSTRDDIGEGYQYAVCLVPVPALVADAVARAAEGGVVNVFAGLPAGTIGQLDLQHIISKQIFVFGTSGSDNKDMRTVITKIERGDYDTTVSLDAITGMAGFGDAIQSVIDRTSGGKIMVYPSLREQGLVRLQDLADTLPSVAALLDDGLWTKAAEEELLRTR